VYYIAKEYIMTMVDEFINGTLSKMINRIKKGLLISGDYRYYLT
jgi:hypothetical protein